GFQVGGSTSASIVGTVVSAFPTGTEIPFIRLQCSGTANGTTYDFYGDFVPGVELSTDLGTSDSTSHAFQGCAYDARVNSRPYDGGGAWPAVGDFLQFTFDQCGPNSSGPQELFVVSGYFSAVLEHRPP